MNPLNSLLHRNLLKAFNGHVRTSSDGLEMISQYIPDWTSDRPRLSLEISVYGETYCVNCPFCSDTRQRLWINHRWAATDTETGDSNLHLAKCFNEDCLATGEKQRQLHALVFPHGMWADKVELPSKPAAPAYVPQPVVISPPPGTPLDRLRPGDPARRYLVRRGFDPDFLARDYGVRYSPMCTTSRPVLCDPRIVIPIFAPSDSIDGSDAVEGSRRLKLAGWQARPPRDDLAKDYPKYLTSTGTKKTHLLYGLPYALKSKGPVVIVEGITDAWRVGKCGVAILGKYISAAQCSLILRYLGRRPIVVFLDPDAEGEALKIRDAIRSARAAAGDGTAVELAVVPPGRKDPGECTPAEIQQAIANALGNDGKRKGRKKAKA